MTALLDFQRTLARAVMQPLSTHDKMKRGSRDGVALVKPNSRLTAFERLEIYNRSYWSRVLDAFSEDFPGVRALLGAKRFDLLRRSYLHDCPSQSFTMRDLGRHLVEWMAAHPALVGPNHAIALSMAKLEWAEVESFDSAEHERLTPEDIASIDPNSSLQLQPHLRLVEAAHAVDSLVLETRESAKRHHGVPRALVQKRIERAKSASPIYLAIHRFELVVHYKRLDCEMFRLLSALATGATITDAIGFAYSASPLTAEQCRQHIQNTFTLFAALGWFCKPSLLAK
jgi:hypothetical protein